MPVPGVHPLRQGTFIYAYIAILISTILSAIEATVVAVALPTITEDIGGADLESWVGTAFLLTHACLTPWWGRMADVFGRKTTVLSTMTTFALGCLGCGSAGTMGQLILWRAVAGAGAGGISFMNRVIIADTTTLQERGKYQGGLSAVWGISTSIGGFAGGALLSVAPWPMIFLINLPVVGVAAFLHARYLNVPQPAQNKNLQQHLAEFDIFGLLFIVGGSAGVLFGLSRGAVEGFFGVSSIYLVLGVTALGCGAYTEVHTSAVPIIPPEILKITTSAATLGINAIHGVAFMSASYYLPRYFQVLGHSPMQAGLRTMPFAVGACLTSPTIGFILFRWPRYSAFMRGSLLVMLIGFAGMCVLSDRTAPFWQELLVFVPAIGIGPGWTLQLLCFQASLPKDQIASSLAGFSLTRSMAGAAGVTIGSVIYTSQLQTRLAALDSALPLASIPVGGLLGLEPEDLRQAVIRSHALSLRSIWIFMTLLVSIAFGLSFLIPSSLGQDEWKHGSDKSPIDSGTEEMHLLGADTNLDDETDAAPRAPK